MNITNYLSDCVKNNIPVSFSKYGDGEYNCVTSTGLYNCDRDHYTDKLKNGLIESVKYMVNNTENSYFGLWMDETSQKYWEKFVDKEIKWVDYHSIIIFNDDTPYNIIELLKPNILVKGSDYKKEDVIGANLVDDVILFDYIQNKSTTLIVNKIKNLT